MTPFMRDGQATDPSRRRLLRSGLLGTLLLAGSGTLASLGGCSRQPPAATGLQRLRAEDQAFFAALYPVVLGSSLAPESARRDRQLAEAITSLDRFIAHISPALQEQLTQLLDLLHSSATRGLLTGVWGGWSSASDEQLNAFLLRWRDSSLATLRMGYSQLMQLMVMAWYLVPDSWPAVGYPGPPYQDQLITSPNHY
ncbi:twin-arginine translocation pathway signal protein [Aestuariirhabdus litorea]|uniref:Twin-arginine translocation pathway signal protein n=1 Tax=Aestuariirhabdus litorea TaxID=2528527 RepID=A0A3P3VLT3_9GAMM|nr:twin-arginine translocation pathway signal protein [Aestuariirhabdus litorea]RRJ82679.1 twin-arginine translocation pathway signal protein [Aestuariirhabdus litorea]RWW92839.1 twin-arginine translocation pathway signal protein [Endozoicomonadaceae bacterium GTF-13]